MGLFKRRTKNTKGFTLIELIVVIAILGILAAIMLPRFGGFQDTARGKAALADARNIAAAIEALTADQKTFTATDGADATGATIFSNAEIMGYIGKQLGGALTLTVTSGAVDSFSYVKGFGNDNFTVTYTMTTSVFSEPTKGSGAVTATAIDSVLTN